MRIKEWGSNTLDSFTQKGELIPEPDPISGVYIDAKVAIMRQAAQQLGFSFETQPAGSHYWNMLGEQLTVTEGMQHILLRVHKPQDFMKFWSTYEALDTPDDSSAH